MEADGDGKEAKWADIDDDEDDWAPETIEWNDGTKITLADSNAATALAEEQAAAQALKEKQEAEAKAKMAQPKPTTTVGPNATVLKVGQLGQPKASGLVLKTPSEKPTLVAKASAQTPVKSPWASIPAVDKVPPVPINPPVQIPPQRLQQNEQQRPDLMSPPPSAAMEIAADSFSRSRRDSPNAPPGQLFNSQSGQYETVSTGRRGSMRKDQNFRPPSVLQRPSQSDQRRPAEPSAAFQTHRSGSQQDGGTWPRRGSSTVSGDSGPLGRRVSMNRGPDIPRMPDEFSLQRRDSQPLRSPALSNQQPLVELHSAGASPPQHKALPIGPPADSQKHVVSDREAQKKIMQEKRELAIRRKAEQEAKEEAEKKERIRIKMESLGLEPLPKDKTTDKTMGEFTEKGTEKIIEKNLEHAVDRVTAAKKDFEEEIKIEPKEVKEDYAMPQQPFHARARHPEPEKVVTVSPSPPKPPMPDASGEPKQYGMMKVHGQPLTNGIQSHENTIIDKAKEPTQSSQIAQMARGSPAPIKTPIIAPTIDGETEQKRLDQPYGRPTDQRQTQSRATRQQPWSSLPSENDSYKGWNSNGMTTHSSASGNLWGLPSNYKALGNGTFDQSVQRPHSRHSPFQEHFKSPAPQPIGPPKPAQRPQQSPEAARAPETTSIPVIEDVQTIPTFPSSDGPVSSLSSNRANVGSLTSSIGTSRTPPQPNNVAPQQAPIAPQRGSTSDDHVKSTLAAWGNFHATATREADERRIQYAQKQAEKLAEEAQTGIQNIPQLPPMQETWRQVSGQNGQREIISVAKRQTHSQIHPLQQISKDLRTSPFASGTNTLPPGTTSRNSRFFPSSGQGLQGYNPRAVSLPIGLLRTPSPPPPDSANHPVYAGQGRPLVNLPATKPPKPTVRLPPSPIAPAQSAIAAPVSSNSLRAVSMPLVHHPSWQDRFNGLLGVTKKSSLEGKFTQLDAFSAATKMPLDLQPRQLSASVSLPPASRDLSFSNDIGRVTSKDVEDEEELFENREFGSLPPIVLPSKAPEGVGFVTATKPKRQRGSVKLVESESKEVFDAIDIEHQIPEGLLVWISLPGNRKKSKTLPRPKGRPWPHTKNQHHRHTPNNKPSKNPRPRENNTNYNNPKHTQPGSQRQLPHAGPTPQLRNQQRGKMPDWFNHSAASSIPVQGPPLMS